MPEGDRFEKLDVTERLAADLCDYGARPGFVTFSDIDMTASADLVALARDGNARLAYNHLIVRAVGLALHRVGEARGMVEKSRRFLPATIDAAIPVPGAGVRFLPASMLIRDIGRIDVVSIARAMEVQSSALRASGPAHFSELRRAAWLLNRSWIRSRLVRRFLHSAKRRKKHMGTVHFSFLRDVDVFAPLIPFVGTVIGAGRVRDKVVAQAGSAVVRPMMTVALCGDHKIWSGTAITRFTDELQRILVSAELRPEVEKAIRSETVLS